MPPRITAESCRPRVSDRTMRYHLEWITMTACQFREAEWRRYNNGDMKTHHWKAAESRNFRCDEKRPGTRTNAHGSRVFTRTLTRARMPRQKSVGVEPEGELFLLTFLFIGPSELTKVPPHNAASFLFQRDPMLPRRNGAASWHRVAVSCESCGGKHRIEKTRIRERGRF
jgi:hypothetical protein